MSSKSTLKRHRQEVVRKSRNKMIKSRVKTFLRKAMQSIVNKDLENSKIYIREFVSAIDKSSKRNIYNKGACARYKSRLMLKYNSMLSLNKD